MTEILSQQQTEKDVMKEATAKRSLQEIQQEQEFQEWWDQESARAIAEEAARNNPSSSGRGKGRQRGGVRGRGGKGGRNVKRGDSEVSSRGGSRAEGKS